MLEKLFGGRKDEKKSGTSKKQEAPAPRPSPQPRSSETTPPKESAEAVKPLSPKKPFLHVSEDSLAAEERARAAIAALNAAVPAPVTHRFDLPETSGVREKAAALFAVDEHKQAIDLLVLDLNKSMGNSPKPIWFMLMDAYQALDQQAAFEKSASLFANFFKTSPPSWEGGTSPKPVASSLGIGRNVLVLDGQPSQIHSDKLRDFLTSARQEKKAKLDLSRSRLDEDHALRVDDLRVLLNLMKKLRQHHISTLLMGENQVVEVLRTVIQRELPVPSAELYWELLLEFLQWRGQEDAFEDLAIQYADRFRRSAPGYERDGVVAQAPTEDHSALETPAGVVPPVNLSEAEMTRWLEAVDAHLPLGEGVLWLDFRHVHRVSFDAATLFASRLRSWNLSRENVTLDQPNELVSALFDITGVSDQTTLIPRKR